MPDASPLPETSSAHPVGALRRRWLFGGDEAAWDVLAAGMADDPTAAVPWPIAAVGPPTEPGDRVLLWRRGAGGGVAALCEVVDEEQPPAVSADGRIMSAVKLRVVRALARPIPATRLAREDVLRPVAFFDLLRVNDHRLTPEQDRAFDEVLADWDATEPDDQPHEACEVRVPAHLVPLVTELIESLDGRDAPRPSRPGASGSAGARAPRRARAPRADLVELRARLDAMCQERGTDEFTASDLAQALGIEVDRARTRLRALVDAGLAEATGETVPPRDAEGRPTRGRPQSLHRRVP